MLSMEGATAAGPRGAPAFPTPGRAALTSRDGRQRRHTQATSPQQQSPQLTRHIPPPKRLGATTRTAPEARPSWARFGDVTGRARLPDLLPAPGVGWGLCGTRGTVGLEAGPP